jgi:ATP-dependent helicase/nuclease subunit B
VAALEITFGMDLDGPTWRGALPTGTAVAGSVAVGPAGLARLLALHVGLPAPVSRSTRSVALLDPMAAQAGFWSASAGADPLGTAEALLRWRDELLWAGWTGTPVSPRLDALYRLTASVPPGPVDVAVEALGLAATPALAWHVQSVDGANSGLVARMLDVLRAGHSALLPSLKPSAPEVLLIEPGSLVDGAEAAAHWLGQGGSRLVVGREPLLDDALMWAGLPTLGHSGPVADDPALAVLPAVVALAFDSDHPTLAQRLLRLPASPVHFSLPGQTAGCPVGLAIHDEPDLAGRSSSR